MQANHVLASFATKMAVEEDLVVVDEQPERKQRDEGEASLEKFESRNFEQMSGSIPFKILRTTPGSFSSFP